MPRNGKLVRRRLQQSAVDLYAERGYEATTTAQIADRAGVTERTFFRHFSDKREVLFDGEDDVFAALTLGVAAAPPPLGALDLAMAGMSATVSLLQQNRSWVEPRHHVIATTPALAERALAKEGALTDALAAALRRRGVGSSDATLAAGIAVVGFKEARKTWLQDSSSELETLLATTFAHLGALLDPR